MIMTKRKGKYYISAVELEPREMLDQLVITTLMVAQDIAYEDGLDVEEVFEGILQNLREKSSLSDSSFS